MNKQLLSKDIPKVYEEDLRIRDALLARDRKVTEEYFYKQCYPLFKSVFLNYYTDCECVTELISEIYELVMTVSSQTGKCQLENYKGESSLSRWLKVVCNYYCYNKFKKKSQERVFELFGDKDKKKNEEGDTSNNKTVSIEAEGVTEIKFYDLDKEDALKLIDLMPNKRYRSIIRMRYLEQKTDYETAEALGMSIENYRNKRSLAVEQFNKVYKKEENYGRTI